MKNKIIMILLSVLIIIVGGYFLNEKYKKNTKVIINGNKPYFVAAGKIDLNESYYDKKIVDNYSQYKKIMDSFEMEYEIDKKDFINHDYLSLIIDNDYCSGIIKNIEDISIGKKVDVLVNIDGDCNKCDTKKYLYFIRVDKNTITNQDINVKYQNLSNCK